VCMKSVHTLLEMIHFVDALNINIVFFVNAGTALFTCDFRHPVTKQLTVSNQYCLLFGLLVVNVTTQIKRHVACMTRQIGLAEFRSLSHLHFIYWQFGIFTLILCN